MQLIRCTGKLQKEMGLTKQDLVDDEISYSHLGPWHANLLYIHGKKCVLFTNDKTLFNFIVPGASRSEIKELSFMFVNNLRCVLAAEDFDQPTIDKICNEYADIRYAKTNSRSVLGSMNDLAFHYEVHIKEAGGVNSYQVPSIIKILNQMPMGAINYRYPIEALRAMYERHH